MGELRENSAEKALRWVVNQIPDFVPKTNNEKLLLAIKLNAEAGAKEINRLEAENAALRERLGKAMELPEYVFGCIDGKVEKIATDYLTLGELKNLEANGYSLTEEAAKERLAKFGGGNGKRV